MLVIRAAQIATLQNTLQERFLDETLAQLRVDCHGETEHLPDTDLRRRVLEGMARAQQYGICSASSLQVFVTTMFVLGPHFDRHPAVAKLLHDTSREPEDRLEAVIVELPDRVWQEIAILAGADQENAEGEKTMVENGALRGVRS